MDIRIRFGVPGADIRYRRGVRVVEAGIPLSRSIVWSLAAREPDASLRGLPVDLLAWVDGRWVEYLVTTVAPMRVTDPPQPEDLPRLKIGFDWHEVERPRYADPRLEALLDTPVEGILRVPVGALAILDARPGFAWEPDAQGLSDLPDLRAALRLPPDARALSLASRPRSTAVTGSILSVDQFDPAAIAHVFRVADEMRATVARSGGCDLLKGRVLANLFYEPSTRTSSSFAAAMQRLGGSVVSINEVRYSSVSKGESLPDTVRTLECYCDAVVLRHPEVGAAALAARYARKPIINAGDGIGEHPTQALLDLYTIRAELGTLDGLTVTLVGDLRHGRTVHSLSKLLAHFDVRIRLVSPPSLRMPDDLVARLAAAGVDQSSHDRMDELLAQTDVLYVTRVQKERFSDPAAYDAVQGTYVVTPDTLRACKAKMIVMHPLPRVGEIALEVDADPRAAYFREMEYGMYVRMALLAMVLGKA